MKKFIAFILSFTLVFLLCSCGSKKECKTCRGSGYYQKKTCVVCHGSGYSDYDPYEEYKDIIGG